MSKTVFARQSEAVGLYGVCEDARVEDGESRGQQGWQVGINYVTLPDLLTQIVNRIPGERILALGLSCHGSDSPANMGGLAVEGGHAAWLRESNMASFEPLLSRLGNLLEINGVVYLFACRIGGTEPGRRLLLSLSRQWRGRRVVGFVQEGHQAAGGQALPGNRSCELPGVQFGERNLWGERNIPGAVVALNGQFVRV